MTVFEKCKRKVAVATTAPLLKVRKLHARLSFILGKLLCSSGRAYGNLLVFC